MKTFIGLITSLPPTGFSSGVRRVLAKLPVLCPKCLNAEDRGRRCHAKRKKEKEWVGNVYFCFPLVFNFKNIVLYERIRGFKFIVNVKAFFHNMKISANVSHQ